MQENFVRATISHSFYQNEDVRAWLFKVARNAYLDGRNVQLPGNRGSARAVGKSGEGDTSPCAKKAVWTKLDKVHEGTVAELSFSTKGI
ncbi:hypothetical protein G3A_13200 [Bacillus sp. 17376]|nr:hypothetical protein G3A_13200 [Bacillus sp. 17376]